MSHCTALLDANVLYPAPIRDVLMQIALPPRIFYKAKWSEDIHREWIEALMRNRPHMDRAALEHTRDLMNQKIRDCLVTDYDHLIPWLTLRDPNDRHVLAAAIVGGCDVIVTMNRKHFPAESLEPYGISALHPDEFLSNHLAFDPRSFCSALLKIRTRLTNPPFTIKEYLANLVQQGLEITATELEQYKDLL